MWLLILEALAALSLLLFFVWWTMFSGRRRDARPDLPLEADAQDVQAGEGGAPPSVLPSALPASTPTPPPADRPPPRA